MKNEFSKWRQKEKEEPAAAPYLLEEIEGLDGIKANWTDLILADDNLQVKKFKTKGAMRGYITRLKKQRQQEQQQMQIQMG